MLFTFQIAVDSAVEEIASDGSVLDVNARALKIIGPILSADVEAFNQVALALIQAASRRSVPMTFCNPNA